MPLRVIGASTTRQAKQDVRRFDGRDAGLDEIVNIVEIKGKPMSADKPNQAAHLPLADNGLDKTTTVTVSKVAGKSRLYLIPLFMLTLFTGAVIGMYFQPPGLRIFFNATGLEPGAGTATPIAVAIQRVTSQEEVAVVSEGDVLALGRIIPRGDVISVATPSGAGDARIAAVLVSVGDEVEAGDILAVLDNLPQLQSAVTSAEAALRVSDASLTQTRASNTASLAEAQATLDRAQATADVAQSELERVTALFERGVTTRAAFDQIVARPEDIATIQDLGKLPSLTKEIVNENLADFVSSNYSVQDLTNGGLPVTPRSG